jgi:predicted TPR repeat methyltransferase
MSAATAAPPAAEADLPEATLSPDDAVALAVSHHRTGRLADAEALYEAVLRHQPERVEVLNFLGILRHQCDRLEDAARLFARVVQLAPASDGAWNNLGNVLIGLGRLDDAAAAFKSSLELAETPQGWSNLSRVFRRRDRFDLGEQACRRALAMDPDHGPSLHNLALALLGLDRHEEAVAAELRAMQVLPLREQRRQVVCQLLHIAGKTELMVTVLRAWHAQDPAHPYPQHHLAACTGQDVPERASDAYVEKVFDNFAPSFDAKLAHLGYRGPRIVADAVAAALPAPAARLSVADLGCGTGLCGPLVKPWARRLVGCDLSSAMLQLAARRAVYDELVKAELTAFLRAHPAAFDLVVSADTLIYFGELREVALAAHDALRADGLFVFTLEALAPGEAGPYRLHDHGRYAHDGAQARQVFEAAGLQVEAPVRVEVRRENQVPVLGWLLVARRPR